MNKSNKKKTKINILLKKCKFLLHQIQMKKNNLDIDQLIKNIRIKYKCKFRNKILEYCNV